ncbi:hypothetical protein KR009_003415 [Drosophila setifemur]|nr:hypothetical protein KR009_003415 [Drosophila setifemur]
MASKRLMIDKEEEEEEAWGLENDENQENQLAKRHRRALETPLHRMLKHHIPASGSGCSMVLSPITELSQHMRCAQLDAGAGGTPKSTQRTSRAMSCFKSNSSRVLSSFNSLSSSYDSGNSLDDEYLAMFEVESEKGQDSFELPEDLEQLISGPLKTEHGPSSAQSLGHKSQGRKLERKALSMNDAEILSALDDEPELIGDLSRQCALPCLLTGIRHRDLKTISCETLARLIRGEFAELLGNKGGFEIIDCRYPYEFLGGHIRGAKNLYTRGQIQEAFPSLALKDGGEVQQHQPEPQRHIFVFHCEFSSERGPKLLRFLRSNDRSLHTHNYPTLDYPELYLLHNGYKEFFGTYAQLCEPSGYVPMLAPVHNEEFRHFRAKTKSWQCGEGGDSGIGGGGSRTLRKSRSRLVYAE